MSSKASQRGPAALPLIEEALHLVRCLPLAVLARYYAVLSAWTFCFLLFWAHTTWFAPSGSAVLWSAIGLTLLYAVLKAEQAVFCGRLWEMCAGVPPARSTWGGHVRLAMAQMRLHAWGLLLLPLAFAVTLPSAWIFGFFQTVSVLGCRKADGSELRKEAWRQMLLWPGQQHYALAILAVIGLVVWFNLASAFYVIPWMARHLLGIDNFLGISGWQMLNTTFAASVTMLCWMALDPLIKAFYTLRVFHGQSLRTGDDLRMAISLASRRRLGRVGLALLLFLVLPWPNRMDAAEKPAQTAVNPAELGRAIEGVLEQRDFQWRLRPQFNPERAAEEGPVASFLRQGFKIIEETVRSIRSGVRRLENWIKGLFPEREASKIEKVAKTSSSSDFSVLRVLLYGLMAIVAGLVLYVIYLMVRQGKKVASEVRAGGGGQAAPINLMDENVQAALLPEDGWLALADEQMRKGEWRLALRALYLARLARLGAEGLVVLARFKTNMDYERELRRRAAGRVEIIDRFSIQRRAFECVWYGRETAREELVRSWFVELKGVSAA